jgi:hypothetical protein
MTLRRLYKVKYDRTNWVSGHIYTFKYRPWENDPEPVVVFLNAITGTHPKTGNQWKLFQCINFTYIPKSKRRQFAQSWVKEFDRLNGNTRLTFQKVKRRYPDLTVATRRYIYKTAGYITKSKELPFEEWEKAVVSTFSKDFSKKVKVNLINKFRQVIGRRKRRKKPKKKRKR